MNNATNWKKLLEETQGGNAKAGATAGKVDMNPVDPSLGVAKGNANPVDPSGITQSYYTTPSTSENYETGRPVYQQSQAVQDAAAQLNQHQANKPGEYQSQYGDQIQGLIDSILNRPNFSYDFAADPVYQQYAQQAQRGGQMAMKDAMAESAALTGGYGNSYAQMVGQQSYQRKMEDLNNMIPELREAAYRMYQDEGNTMRDNLGMLQGQDESDYGRYRDTVNDWQTDLNMLYTMYGDMSEQEYNRYLNDQAAWEADRAFWYQQAYDKQQQANWQAEFYAKYGDGSSSGGGSRDRSSVPVTTQKLTDLIASDAQVLNDSVYEQAAEMLSTPPAFVNPLYQGGFYDDLLKKRAVK